MVLSATSHSIPGSASAGAPRARRLTWACTAQFVAVLPSSHGALIALLALQVWNQQAVPSHDCQGAPEALWGTPHICCSLCKFCLRLCVAHASFQLTPKPCLQSKGIDFFAAHPGLSNTSLCESGLCRTTFFQRMFCHPEAVPCCPADSGMQKSAAFFWFFVSDWSCGVACVTQVMLMLSACALQRVSEILFGQSSKRGCISMLYCATAPELEGRSAACRRGRQPVRLCLLERPTDTNRPSLPFMLLSALDAGACFCA